MANLTTGLIENTPVAGVRPTISFTVNISNDSASTETVQIDGYYVSGTTKIQNVLEQINLTSGAAITRVYYAQFNEFEYQFTTSTDAVEISAWGKNAAGTLTTAHRLVPAELEPIGATGTTGATGATGATGSQEQRERQEQQEHNRSDRSNGSNRGNGSNRSNRPGWSVNSGCR
ncbi:hypothetical protein [Desulfosporosinus orientis]|uniref:hypothetical protein n=1 Tax=Desulfosporosinus orientis TaxID=1563 RepID=UPI00031AAE61